MKNYLLLYCLLIIPQAWAGPIVIGQGAGEGEYSVIFARDNLFTIIKDCFDFSCQLTAAEKTADQVILDRSKTPLPMMIKTSADMGDQLYRVFPDLVWINQDLLWLDDAKTIPYDVAAAAALWVEVLNAGALSSSNLESLQDKLRAALHQRIIRQEDALDDGSTFEILQWIPASGIDRLFVRDPLLQTIELTPAIVDHLNCQGNLTAVHFFSPSWMTESVQSDSTIFFTIALGMKWTCGASTRSVSGFISITAKTTPESQWVLDPESVEIDIGGER